MTRSPRSLLLVQLQRTHHPLHVLHQRYDASRRARQLWTRRTFIRLNTPPLRSREKRRDGEKVLSPATSPSRPLGRSNTMTSPIRPIDVSSSSRRKRTISDVGDMNERVRDKVRLLRGSSTAGSTTFSFGDASTDPLEGVKRRLFSLSSHYTAQYHSDPTFDSLPPSSSQGSTSSVASDYDRKPPIPSSSSSLQGPAGRRPRLRTPIPSSPIPLPNPSRLL
jgi:hypothetical protein